MDRENKQQIYLHYAVCLIGGFLGGYAIINHSGVFGNAQTANLINAVYSIMDGDFGGLLFLLLSLVTYMAGMSLHTILKRFSKIDVRALALVFDAVAVVFAGLMCNIENDYIALLPIIFATSFQWCSFRTAGGYISSTIFSTNNLRQATTSLVSYAIDKKKEDSQRAKFYWLTLLSFHIGVATSCAGTMFVGVHSIWFCLAPVVISAVVYIRATEFNFGFRQKQAEKCTAK